MSPNAEAALLKGLVILKTFQCDHNPSCDQAEEKRGGWGGCCNSCWGRRWAEDMDRLLNDGPQPDFSKAS